MYTLRAPTPEDASALADLCYEKWSLVARPNAATLDDLRQHYGHLIDAANRFTITAEQDARVVGFIAARADDHAAIHELLIDLHGYYPGLGRALTREARSWLAARQIQRCVIESSPAAVERAFWASVGAVEQDGKLWLQIS